jgi:glycosyltransferase involved in cell wall biosynthesis
MVSDRWPLRGIEARALRKTRRLRYRTVLRAANSRYRSMLTVDPEQIPYFRGKVIVDRDEPHFSAREVELLNRPNVAAVVVISDAAARHYEELGLETPCHVITQGVDLGLLSHSDIASVAERHRDEGELVMGYISAWFLTPADRRHDVAYDIGHLLELWAAISARLPHARLWLIGRASKQARTLCAARGNVTLFEHIPYGGALPYIANFDIALYPRRDAPRAGDLPVKLIEYMGAGVPVVSYETESTAVVRQTGAGVPASTPGQFVEAVERLALEEPERRRLAANARAAGSAFDWSDLIRRYQDEVLDRYLV